MILQKLKLLVRNEYDDLVMDVKNPLLLFQEFCNGLSRVPQKLKIDKKTAIMIRELLKTGDRSVTKEFNKLVNTTIKFIENDFKYYEETELALQTHLKRRTTAKRQITGKITWISKQLQKVEEILNRLSAKTPNQSLQELSQVVSYFRTQFEGLVNFSLNRIQVANYTIIEALVLERDYLKELKKIEVEIERFYGLIFQQEEKLRQSSVSRLHKNKTRISGKISEGRSELTNIKKELKNQEEAEKAEKEHLEKRIKNTEVQESNIIREERKEAKKALKKVSKFKKAILLTLAIGGIPILLGTTAAGIYAFSSKTPIIAVERAIENPQNQVTISLNNRNIMVGRNSAYIFVEGKGGTTLLAGYKERSINSSTLNDILSMSGHMSFILIDGEGSANVAHRYYNSEYLPLKNAVGYGYSRGVKYKANDNSLISRPGGILYKVNVINESNFQEFHDMIKAIAQKGSPWSPSKSCAEFIMYGLSQTNIFNGNRKPLEFLGLRGLPKIDENAPEDVIEDVKGQRDKSIRLLLGLVADKRTPLSMKELVSKFLLVIKAKNTGGIREIVRALKTIFSKDFDVNQFDFESQEVKLVLENNVPLCIKAINLLGYLQERGIVKKDNIIINSQTVVYNLLRHHVISLATDVR